MEKKKLGHLRLKYIIEDNKELQDLVKEMVKQDTIAQWLVGDELKQDQFKFFYDTCLIIYDSALRDKLLNEDAVVIDSVLPKLVAYRAIMVIRNIQMVKAAEIKKAKEKAEREGRVYKPEEEIEEETDPLKMTQEQLAERKLKNEEKGGVELSEAQKEAAKEAKEREKYGRYWIWEGYFNEKNKEKWLETAESLKHINDHVLQDIEDFIMLEALRKDHKKDKLKQFIDDDLAVRNNQLKKLDTKTDPDDFDQMVKDRNKKRKFMNTIRPPYYWNFFDDAPAANKVDHVLRYDADPTKCYSDGRVEQIMTNIEEIGMNLKAYQDTIWKLLRQRTLDIFKEKKKQLMKDLDA